MSAVERHTVDRRGEDVARHTAEMLDQMGRALSAVESGNWASFRARLESIRYHSMAADMEMNGDRYPASPSAVCRSVREGLARSPWSRTIAGFLPERSQ